MPSCEFGHSGVRRGGSPCQGPLVACSQGRRPVAVGRDSCFLPRERSWRNAWRVRSLLSWTIGSTRRAGESDVAGASATRYNQHCRSQAIAVVGATSAGARANRASASISGHDLGVGPLRRRDREGLPRRRGNLARRVLARPASWPRGNRRRPLGGRRVAAAGRVARHRRGRGGGDPWWRVAGRDRRSRHVRRAGGAL